MVVARTVGNLHALFIGGYQSYPRRPERPAGQQRL